MSLLRRQLYREATQLEKAALKGSRRLLLKAPENLKAHRSRKKDECFRLQRALQLNQPLAVAYYMKERFRLLFQYLDRQRAETIQSFLIPKKPTCRRQGKSLNCEVDLYDSP